MKNIKNTQKAHLRSGFTATEALVGVSILSVLVLALIAYSGGFIKTGNQSLTGSIIGTFGAFEDGSDIDEVAKTIVSDLGSVQAKSKTGVEDLVWGTCFRSDKNDDKDNSGSYDIVSNIAASGNACAAAEDKVNEVRLTVELPKDIKLTDPSNGGTRYVVFKKVTGETTSVSDLHFKISSADASRIITVTNEGIITYSEGVPPATTTTTATVISGATSPSAPQGLATAVGANQIAVAWVAPKTFGNSALVEYRVYRGTTAGTGSMVASVNPADTLFMDNNVVPGITYFYRVSARNLSFESAFSNEASATAAGAAVSQPVTQTVNTSTPSAPRALDADGGRGQIVLTWSAPTSAGTSSIIEYTIYRSKTSGGGQEQVGTASRNATTFTDPSLGSNKTYFYRVSARNAAGFGAQSNEASATTRSSGGGGGGGGGSNNNNNLSAPSAPQNLAAVAGNNQVVLSWTAPTGSVAEYRVYRSVVSNGNNSMISSGSASTAFTDTAAFNGTTYYYKVRAVNGSGAGPDSNEVSATPTAGGTNGGGGGTNPTTCPSGQTGTPPNCTTNPTYTNPSAPNLSFNGSTTNTISLSWTAPSTTGGAAITEYRLCRKSPSTSGCTIFIFNGNTLSYTDPNLSSGTTYFYSIVALNGHYESQKSNSVSGTTTGQTNTTNTTYSTPSSPYLSVNSVTANSISLSWTAPAQTGGAAITEYRICRKEGSLSAACSIIIVSGGTLSHTDSGLQSGKDYFYTIVANNGHYESVKSNMASGTTK